MRGLSLFLIVLGVGCGSVSPGGSDPDGAVVDAEADAALADAACEPGVGVIYTGTVLPADIAGFYDEAFDCVAAEGGANFGGVDTAHCFRHQDGSAWRIWNTGCGWEIGLVEGDPAMWERHARTYTGQCSEIPPDQLTTEALTTDMFVDGFGDPIADLSSALTPCSQ
jgi:hypothetical protein